MGRRGGGDKINEMRGVVGFLSGQQSGGGDSNVLPSFYVVLCSIWYRKKQVGDLPLQVEDHPRGVGELD